MDTEIHIYRLPDIAYHYPPARVPMLPVLTKGSLVSGQHQAKWSRFFQPHVCFHASGRIAFYHALRAAALEPGDEVLLPAYHCGSMLEPLIWLGLTPVFYPLNNQLEIDPQQLLTLISRQSRALLLPHFFGFPQPLLQVKRFCQRHGLLLIEDCAHSFFSTTQGLRLGYEGDFSIASTVKFFPGNSGGALACNNHRYLDQLKALKSPGWKSQLKGVLNPLEAAANYDKLGWWSRLFRRGPRSRAAGSGLTLLRRYASKTEATRPLVRQNLHWFDKRQIGIRGTKFHHWLLYHSNCSEVMHRRRENYRYYLERLAGISQLTPLHQDLPDGVYPYVFPLLLSQPDVHFPRLKLLGVPIWRWEELALCDCSVSSSYRLKLLQLPCHQALTKEELDWIIDQIIEVVSGPL